MADDQLIREQLVETLRGGDAFEPIERILRELPEVDRFMPVNHKGRSAWQIVEHMRCSLEDLAQFIDNSDGSYQEKNWPDDYWPADVVPEEACEWDESVSGLYEAQRKIERLILDPSRDLLTPFPWGSGQTLLREALLAIEHNAYHSGQLVEITAALD